MKLIKYPDRSQWNEILKRPVLETENLFRYCTQYY